MLAREQEDGDGAGCDRRRLHDEQERRAGPEPPERRERRDDRVEMRAEPGDLAALLVGHLEEMPVRGRPHRLRQVAEVVAAAPEGGVARLREPGEAGGEAGGRRGQQEARRETAGHAASCSNIVRQRPPSTASLAARSYVCRPPAPIGGRGRDRAPAAAPRPRAPGRLPAARAARPSPSVKSSRAAGRVGGHERNAARERLERLVGDHPSRFRRRSEDPESAAGRHELCRRVARTRPTGRASRCAGAVESPPPSCPLPTIRNGISHAILAAARIVSRPCSGISFPTNRAWNGPAGRRAGTEEPLLGADEAHLDAAGSPARSAPRRTPPAPQCPRRRVGVPERRAVDRVQRARGERRRPKARAVGDERVEQRHERVEHDRTAAAARRADSMSA